MHLVMAAWLRTGRVERLSAGSYEFVNVHFPARCILLYLVSGDCGGSAICTIMTVRVYRCVCVCDISGYWIKGIGNNQHRQIKHLSCVMSTFLSIWQGMWMTGWGWVISGSKHTKQAKQGMTYSAYCMHHVHQEALLDICTVNVCYFVYICNIFFKLHHIMFVWQKNLL